MEFKEFKRKRECDECGHQENHLTGLGYDHEQADGSPAVWVCESCLSIAYSRSLARWMVEPILDAIRRAK